MATVVKQQNYARAMSEHDMQVGLFQWAAYAGNQYPELALMFAVPNGGFRHPSVAAKMKAEGVKPGVPDVCLPVPRGQFCGLWLELKKPGGYPTPAQTAWHKRLTEVGHRVEIVRSIADAIDVIVEYLSEG